MSWLVLGDIAVVSFELCGTVGTVMTPFVVVCIVEVSSFLVMAAVL